MKYRAGTYINQSAGYRAFIPKPLPPEPPIRFDDELQSLLSKADRVYNDEKEKSSSREFLFLENVG